MSRNVKSALLLSIVVCGVAAAQPQTVSYYGGACSGMGICQLDDSLPPQGFVLTDVLHANPALLYLSVQEGSITKAQFVLGEVANGGPQRNQSYHLQSGIPFAGAASLNVAVGGNTNASEVTLIGYIPGTAAGSVPAVGTVGLAIMLLGMIAAGGLVLRWASMRQATIA
jgi:hypothetical protein